MKKYKKELDSIHMSEDLKQKIRSLPYEDMSKKKTFPLIKVLLPISCILILFIGFISLDSLDNKKKPVPTKKDEIITVDNGKQIYNPTISGLIGGMGGTNTFLNEEIISSSKFIPKSLPVYQYQYKQDINIFNANENDKEELLAWLKKYANKLSIDENIEELYYRNDDVSLMIMPDASLSITFSNVANVPEKINANELKTLIKEKTEVLMSFKNSTWECTENYCDVYEKGKTKKEAFLNKELNNIKITPHFLPSNNETSYNIELEITIRNPNSYQKINDVSIVDEKSARSLLKRGGFYYLQKLRDEVLPETIEENQILSVQLMYGNPQKQDISSPYIVPIYRYQVKLSENDIRFLDVVAIPQKELKQFDQVSWYFENEK